MQNDWEVKIQEQPGGIHFNVFMFRMVGEDIEVMNSKDTVTRIKKGDPVEPSFLMHRSQLKAMAEGLHAMGINPEKEYIAGKLEATESHLADMRSLLKLK